MSFDQSKFASRLRGKRAELDMTQQELAERAGVSQEHVFQYEDGGYLPGADKLCALAQALGTTPNYLLGWEQEADSCSARFGFCWASRYLFSTWLPVKNKVSPIARCSCVFTSHRMAHPSTQSSAAAQARQRAG